MEHLTRQELRRVNLTDEDAQLMKGRQGIMPAYNAQAMVSPLDPSQASGSGLLVTAADVVNTAADSGQRLHMLEESEEMTEVRVPVTLADGGYHTAKNLEAGARRGDVDATATAVPTAPALPAAPVQSIEPRHLRHHRRTIRRSG